MGVYHEQGNPAHPNTFWGGRERTESQEVPPFVARGDAGLSQVWGVGLGVWGLGFEVWGLGSGVWDSGFGV